MGRHPEADLSKLSRLPAAARPTKVSVQEFARPLEPAAAAAVIRALPDQLAARTLREVIARTAAAHRAGRPVVLMAGGHVVKVGVTPCWIELIERGVVTHVAMNGAAAIHDVEIARLGRTSEDVEAHLHAGSFGMVDETGDFMNAIASAGVAPGASAAHCGARIHVPGETEPKRCASPSGPARSPGRTTRTVSTRWQPRTRRLENLQTRFELLARRCNLPGCTARTLSRPISINRSGCINSECHTGKRRNSAKVRGDRLHPFSD